MVDGGSADRWERDEWKPTEGRKCVGKNGGEMERTKWKWDGAWKRL